MIKKIKCLLHEAQQLKYAFQQTHLFNIKNFILAIAFLRDEHGFS